jgi:hypothetical protein
MVKIGKTLLEMDETGSGSCTLAKFGISDADPSGSANKD